MATSNVNFSKFSTVILKNKSTTRFGTPWTIENVISKFVNFHQRASLRVNDPRVFMLDL